MSTPAKKLSTLMPKESAPTVPSVSEEKPKRYLWLRYLIPIAVGLAIWFSPAPAGVSAKGWQLLAIFVGTIVGIISQPLPMGAVAITGIALCAVTGTLSIGDSLSGFADGTIWLIVVAFMFARGFIKTGLGSRIAYLFIAAFGKKSLGLGYSLAATDLVLSPAMPSNTARAGGVVYPVLRSIASAYGSEPDDGTARKLGAFLVKNSFQATIITSAMFMTAMAANPLVVKLAGDQGLTLTWGSWALAGLVPGLVSLALVPWILYKVYPPEIKETPDAVKFAKDRLRELGLVKRAEWTMLGVFILVLALWIFAPLLGNLNATTTALTGLAILLIAGVLTWDDVEMERKAWDTLIWFAALVMMASFLGKLGVVPWFSKQMAGSVKGLDWITAHMVLLLVYFYAHYMFASMTAHIAAMYAPFLIVSIAAGTPPMFAALTLAFASSLHSSTTHYGTGPAPMYFGSGYVTMGAWWGLGLLVSVVNIVVWLVVGGLWWKVLGLW